MCVDRVFAAYSARCSARSASLRWSFTPNSDWIRRRHWCTSFNREGSNSQLRSMVAEFMGRPRMDVTASGVTPDTGADAAFMPCERRLVGLVPVVAHAGFHQQRYV